jgi:starvation-inducible DNA-binding protein
MEVNVNIGLSINVRQQIAQNLSLLLSDSFVLYTKTQNFCWNITNPQFYSIHLFLKGEIEKLSQDHKEIAERIRILGEQFPGSLKQFLAMTSLKESDGDLTADEMLLNLINDHETICRFIRDRIILVSKLRDEGTAALLVQLLCSHEKSVWMLRSQLLPISA